jgi:uncharacterized protein
MRVVVDTNVFVSSFFGGNPGKVIDSWKQGKLTLCLIGAIIDEYVDVLMRMGLRGTKELDDLLSLFRNGHSCIFTSQTPKLAVVEDPDDDKFIEAAVALKAELIVSGDAHLKKIKTYAGIAIVSPKEFVDGFEMKQQ